jgi:ParB family chromosome partitioning protein
MQVEHIPVDEIRIPTVRVRSYMSEEIGEQFLRSVQAVGLIEPLSCVREGGVIYLVNGEHRLFEAKSRGDATVPCVITAGSLQDVLLQNLATSGLHGKPKVSEMRRVIEALGEEYGMDSIAIHKKIGLSQDYIEKLQWVNRASDAVQEAIDEGRISLGHAVILARLPAHIAQDMILEDLLRQKWTIKDLAEIVKKVDEWQPPEPAESDGASERPPTKYRCHYCKNEYPPSDMTIAAVCPSCHGTAWKAIQLSPAAIGGEARS